MINKNKIEETQKVFNKRFNNLYNNNNSMEKSDKKQIALIGVFIILAWVWYWFSQYTKSQHPSLQKKEIIQENTCKNITLEMCNQFSVWDGSHSKLQSYIKENLKDPSSFDHIETRYSYVNGTFIVTMKYRAKNSFGGMIIEEVKAKINEETGEVIEVISVK